MTLSRTRFAGWFAGLGLVHALWCAPAHAESMQLKTGARATAPAERAARPAKSTRASADATAEAAAPKPKTRRNGVTVAYDKLKKSWHLPPSAEELARYNAAALPPLVFHVVHDEDEPPVVLIPSSDRGDFSEDELEKAKLAFKGKPEHPGVHPRTLSLVYRAMRHFNAPYVHLISGIRPDRGGSRHTHGHAADIVIPGVSDETLANYFRSTYGFVGVGMYTRAGFVHIDTREESFYWLDRSLPGKKGGRIQPIMKEEAAAADVAARDRGEEPYPDPPRLVRALKVRLKKIVKANQEKRRVKAERMAQVGAQSAQ
jgi:Peptidase M15